MLINCKSTACVCLANFLRLSLSDKRSASKTSWHDNCVWNSVSVSSMRHRVNANNPLNDELGEVSSIVESGIFDVQKGSIGVPEQNEEIRFSQVGRKKDFAYFERIGRKPTNILQGLELHTWVFSDVKQKNITDYVYNLQTMGQKGQLREHTYSKPKKWMRGKGRVTIQFGCCYNYAVDKNGNPPGIIRDEEVDPIPPLFKTIIKRLIRWNILPPTCSQQLHC